MNYEISTDSILKHNVAVAEINVKSDVFSFNPEHTLAEIIAAYSALNGWEIQYVSLFYEMTSDNQQLAW